MPSNIDIQKVILSLGESKAVNLDLSLSKIVSSSSVGLINSVAHLEPWELICYTWVTYIRRRAFNELVIPIEQQRLRGALEGIAERQG